MKRKSPIKPTGLSLIFNCPLPFNFRYKRGLVACVSPFSGGREEEIVERRGEVGRERGSFFPFAVSPFHIFLSPFPQKPLTLRQGFWAPDFGYLDAGLTTLLLLFLFLYCKTTYTHLFPLQCFTMNAKKPVKTKQNSCSLFKN